MQQLLLEISDAGAGPEDVCGDCPELLPEVRRRWLQMRTLQAALDELFPESDPGPGADTAVPGQAAAGLPQIPGYEVESLLGRGGMGLVYKARHLRLNRFVALKMLITGAYAGPRERARFQRESEAVAGLRHANIVQVYDVGEHEGRPYFTMEFVEGGTLTDALAGTPQPAMKSAETVATLARAVQAAHASGIIHRDLKPSNVLLTADGTLKLTDFGLARRIESGPDFTVTGVRIGTASYMAPEQALGNTSAMGPAVDVYALGAILYELLTGRPPFEADTPAETERQVINDEPVAPARLNANVHRDLETICLKCLCKEPPRRYATAAALADDLERFQRGEPIAARPAGSLEHGLRWVWRRRAGAGLVASALALFAMALAGGLWVRSERATSRQAVEQLDRLEETLRDEEFAARLDVIHLRRAAMVVGRFDISSHKTQADQEYEAAFREAGLGRVHDDPEIVGARVEESRVRESLVAALDDWAVCAAHAADQRRQGWLLAVARRADRDPTGSRNQLRDPAAWRNQAALAERIETALAARPPVELLVALGERFGDLGGDAIPFLTRVRHEYPGDFWANLALGDALAKEAPGEAIRYYQTAQVIRPGAAVAYHNLGIALAASSRLDEAIGQHRHALRIDPKYGLAHYHLGISLRAEGQVEAAIEHLQQALRIDPGFDLAHYNLGLALKTRGRFDDAIDHFRQALKISPHDGNTHYNLGLVLKELGRVDEAIDHYTQALEIDPRSVDAHYNLALALIHAGRADEAIDHFRQAVQIEPNHPAAHTHLGLALQSQGQLDEAIKHFQEVVRINREDGLAHYNLGLALKTRGRLDEAIDHFRESLRISPRDAHTHYNLGLVLKELGRVDEAIDHFTQALETDPKSVDAHYNLALALIDAGRADDAIDRFRQTVRIDPNHAAAHTHLGIALQSQGQLDAALLEFQNALRIDSTDAYTHNSFGLALQAKGRLDEAIAHFKKAIKLNPQFGPAHNNCALALKAKGKLDEAIKHFQEALRINREDAFAHYNLGLVLIDTGRMDDAIDHLRQALALEPANRGAKAALQRALAEKGVAEKSAAEMSRP